MQQIAEWLDHLGMSEYAEHFAENKIDVRQAPPPMALAMAATLNRSHC